MVSPPMECNISAGLYTNTVPTIINNNTVKTSMILFVVLFNALVFAKCGKIKRRSAEEDYCDDYDGDGPDPINKEFCYKLPLTSELCGDGKMPYKCCYSFKWYYNHEKYSV